MQVTCAVFLLPQSWTYTQTNLAWWHKGDRIRHQPPGEQVYTHPSGAGPEGLDGGGGVARLELDGQLRAQGQGIEEG